MSQVGPNVYEKAIEVLTNAKEDVEKFYGKEVNAAGGRLRKVWKQVFDLGRAEKKNILEVRSKRMKK